MEQPVEPAVWRRPAESAALALEAEPEQPAEEPPVFPQARAAQPAAAAEADREQLARRQRAAAAPELERQAALLEAATRQEATSPEGELEQRLFAARRPGRRQRRAGWSSRLRRHRRRRAMEAFAAVDAF